MATKINLNNLTKLREGRFVFGNPTSTEAIPRFRSSAMGKRKSAPDDEGISITLFLKHDTNSHPACTGTSGSSSQQKPSQAHPQTVSSSSKSSPKRARKNPQSSDATPENRGAGFKKSCPKNIQDCVARVMSQR